MKREIIFKDRLKELRKQAKLQQKELGEQIGLSANAISMIETGNRETSFEKLVMLAEFFHVSTDYLLGVTDDPTWRGGSGGITSPESQAPQSNTRVSG